MQFDDSALVQFAREHEVLSWKTQFFHYKEEPIWSVMVSYRSPRKITALQQSIPIQERAKKFARKFQNIYCLKIDIRHCFETVNHDILMRKLIKRIRCKRSLWLCEQIIRHGGVEGKGLPIGNLSSQHFANFYLDSLDHFCVEKLKIKGFIRYMDDILLFSHCKDHLLEVLGELTILIPELLDQHIKHSATRLVPIFHGVPFLGFRIFPSFTRFDQSRKRRFIRKWKQLEKADQETQQRGFHSLIAWSEQANTRQFRRNLLQ